MQEHHEQQQHELTSSCVHAACCRSCRITPAQQDLLKAAVAQSKRPETDRKYEGQHKRFLVSPARRQQERTESCLTSAIRAAQWHMEHNPDGSEREKPYSPDLSLDDGAEKAISFMMWVARNYPGWEHPKKAQQLVRV